MISIKESKNYLQNHKTPSFDNSETSSLTNILLSPRSQNEKYHLHNRQSSHNSDIFSSSQAHVCSRCSRTHRRGSSCIGMEFQAEIPEVLTLEARKDYESSTEAHLQVWSPTDLPDDVVEAYLRLADGKNYNLEQAFGLLFWVQHDIERATEHLEIFKPCPESWNENENLIFGQGFSIYGKELREFLKMLPRKSLKEIVEHYYLWKEKSLRTPPAFYTVDDSDIESTKSSKKFYVRPNMRQY